MNRALVAAAFWVSFASRAAAQVPADWDKAYAVFSEGYRKLDAAMVTNLYAENAYYLQPGSDVLRGRAEIHRIFDSFFKSVAARGDSIRIAFDFVDRSVSGDLGYDIGHYILTSYSAGKAPNTSRGKFVVLWKRGADKAWKIYTDGYSGVQ